MVRRAKPTTGPAILNGRCTATVNSATTHAPPTSASTEVSRDVTRARATGRRRRSQTAAQDSAPSTCSTAMYAPASPAMSGAEARVRPQATRNRAVSTTQSRVVRRVGRSPSPSPRRTEGSSHRYSNLDVMCTEVTA
ncbi:hypothetical protein [Microtetraspora niveoalba]|uniref:hypothetical protein n=1 Tax=Microtetraspora niveoalba TaxID=46175 RepID=UPI00082F2A34